MLWWVRHQLYNNLELHPVHCAQTGGGVRQWQEGFLGAQSKVVSIRRKLQLLIFAHIGHSFINTVSTFELEPGESFAIPPSLTLRGDSLAITTSLRHLSLIQPCLRQQYRFTQDFICLHTFTPGFPCSPQRTNGHMCLYMCSHISQCTPYTYITSKIFTVVLMTRKRHPNSFLRDFHICVQCILIAFIPTLPPTLFR